MLDCNHEQFDVQGTVVRSNDSPVRFKLDLMVKCVRCDTPFRFGRSFVSSTDGLELTALLWEGPLKINRQLPDEVLKEMATWSGKG